MKPEIIVALAQEVITEAYHDGGLVPVTHLVQRQILAEEVLRLHNGLRKLQIGYFDASVGADIRNIKETPLTIVAMLDTIAASLDALLKGETP